MKERYLQVKIYPSGRVTKVKCDKNYIDYTGGDLYNVSGLNSNKRRIISYDYFITTEKRFNKDCRKHFHKMTRELNKEYRKLDKKRLAIHKMILNTVV